MTSADTQNGSDRLSYNRTIGVTAMFGRGFYYPVDIVAGEDDRLYVLNRSSDGDKRGVRITVMNLEEEYFGIFGAWGEENGQFMWPNSIAIDSDKRLFISDDYLDTVHRIEALNTYSKSVGEGPVTVAVDTAISVPNLWYFRNYEALVWTDSASAQHASADFVLSLPESGITGVAPDLADHQATRMPLRDWWAPQFESYHDGWFSGWGNWLVDREVWNEGTLGSTDFDLSVSPRALYLEARMGGG